jgi:hypothetical protein
VEGIAVPIEGALLHVSEIYGLRLTEWKLCQVRAGTVLFDAPHVPVQKQQKEMLDAFEKIIANYAQWEKAYL